MSASLFTFAVVLVVLAPLVLLLIGGFLTWVLCVLGFAVPAACSPKQLAKRANWLYLGSVLLAIVASVMQQIGIFLAIKVVAVAAAFTGAGIVALVYHESKALPGEERGWIACWIKGCFGGYIHQIASIDSSLPERIEKPKRVAVIGSGLAGLGATTRLAERGFSVCLYEREEYLGGKVGAWKTTMPDGREIGVYHGMHIFFPQYHNLNHWLKELGIASRFRSLGDYMILKRDGSRLSFACAATTPILNLFSLAYHGMYSLTEVAMNFPKVMKLLTLLRYDEKETFAALDNTSYAQFAKDADVPESLRLIFHHFSRTHFTDDDKMSMAELVKSFHFYYMSNNEGLVCNYLDDEYERSLLGPIREHMQRNGADIRMGRSVEKVTRESDGSYLIDGERFDYLVISTDVVGTRALFQASPSLREAAPDTAAMVEKLRPGQRYAVYRIWLDRPIANEDKYPGVVITQHLEVLDSVTFVDRNEKESGDWVAERRANGQDGCVIEMHCYAVPVGMPYDEQMIKKKFLAELEHYFPDMKEAKLIHDHWYSRQDFANFQLGTGASRPTWNTELDNLFLAGDWVKMHFPAYLMEAAYSSGLLAANAISRRESVRETQVLTVPQRGLIAGWPKIF